jgi:hypothetical protein
MNNVIPVVTLRDLNFSKSGVTIPVGTNLNLSFSEKFHRQATIEFNGKRFGLRISNLHATVKSTNGVKFSKMPSMNRLEKMNDDGICTTVTGCRVEPDGFGPDNSPSWLMVMGVI